MAAVAGQGLTYNLPNFVGELFKLTATETPLLSMVGGVSGGRRTTSTQFTIQTADNTAPSQPNILEGVDPVYEERDRAEVVNVVQIFQYGVDLSYTKQAAVGQLGGEAIIGNQPVQDEAAWQLQMKLERAARDVNLTFHQGVYQKPANNSTARRSRGMETAITTNAVAAGSTDLSKTHIDTLMRTMVGNDAPLRMPVFFAGAFNKQKFSEIYGYAPESRTVGGVNIAVVETDFARVGIVFDRDKTASAVGLYDVSVVAPVMLTIPGKGHFFIEPLAKTGASDKWQLYGEIGLQHGPEIWHGEITGTTTS